MPGSGAAAALRGLCSHRICLGLWLPLVSPAQMGALPFMGLSQAPRLPWPFGFLMFFSTFQKPLLNPILYC